MIFIVGLCALFFCVFGVFILHGGSIDALIIALPGELVTILGAGIAAMIIGNKLSTLQHLLFSLKRMLTGDKWVKKDFLDTIILVSGLFRSLRTSGPKSIEEDIENPYDSSIFAPYPKLLKDKHLIQLICDTLRLFVAATGGLNPYAVEDLMDERIKSFQSHNKYAEHALRGLAGSLPALGIVACVLGIVNTMASIDQPPEILGVLIGSALLGTFLGIFLSYGIVEPIANRLKLYSDDDANIYHVVKQIAVATLRKHPQPLVIEAARVAVHEKYQPTFDEVFEILLK